MAKKEDRRKSSSSSFIFLPSAADATPYQSGIGPRTAEDEEGWCRPTAGTAVELNEKLSPPPPPFIHSSTFMPAFSPDRPRQLAGGLDFAMAVLSAGWRHHSLLT